MTTPTGPGRSRLNSFKHGMRSTDVLFLAKMTDDERVAFEQLRDDLFNEYQPRYPHEVILVERIVMLHFRAQKLSQLELAAAHKSDRDPLAPLSLLNHLDRISRYEGRLDRCIRAAHNRLCTLQRSRSDSRIKFFNPKE